MAKNTYRAEIAKTNTDKLFEILDRMPSFYRDYILSIDTNLLSTASKLGYARDMEDFFHYLEDNNPILHEKGMKNFTLNDLAQLTKNDVNEYNVSLLRFTKSGQAGYESKTIVRKLASASSFFNEMVRLDKLKENPFSAVRRPKDKKHPPIYLTEKEQGQLLHTIETGEGLSKQQLIFHAPERDLAIVSLFLDTGVRVSELVGLDTTDLILEKSSMVVSRKGGKIQEMFYSDDTRDLLEEYLRFREEKLKGQYSPALFIALYPHNYLGNRLAVRSIEAMLDKYVRVALPMRAGTISPHKLRSTFACTYYAETGDLLLLKDVMGHESVTTTTIYAEAVQEKQQQNRNFRKNFTTSPTKETG